MLLTHQLAGRIVVVADQLPFGIQHRSPVTHTILVIADGLPQGPDLSDHPPIAVIFKPGCSTVGIGHREQITAIIIAENGLPFSRIDLCHRTVYSVITVEGTGSV